jgi:hypothetical protein
VCHELIDKEKKYLLGEVGATAALRIAVISLTEELFVVVHYLVYTT